MSITFRGVTKWTQVKQPEWTVDNWGVDQAAVLFRGPSTGKQAFEDSLRRWTTMPSFQGMRLANWSSSVITPSYPGVELHYVGFRRGDVPPAKPVDGISTQTAQGQGTDTATQEEVSGSFTYIASRTTWTWFEKTLPDPVNPKFRIVRNPQDPLSRITSYSIQSNTTGKRLNNIPYSSFVAIFNSLKRVIVIANYEREMIIPDALWACRCDMDLALA